MRNSGRSPLGCTILGLLAALVPTNVAFLLLQRRGSPDQTGILRRPS